VGQQGWQQHGTPFLAGWRVPAHPPRLCEPLSQQAGGGQLAEAIAAGNTDLVAAAQAVGYSVKMRDSVGGGAGAACLRNLRHSFLILTPAAGSSRTHHTNHTTTEEVIVDPTFRDQFALAHPSPRYSAVLDATPPVFVGPLSTLQPLVALLCAEMARAFTAAGIVLPPWRSYRSMLSKWVPRKSLDLVLQPAGASSTTAAAAAAAAAQHSSAAQHAGGGAGQAPSCPPQALPPAAAATAQRAPISDATSAGLSCLSGQLGASSDGSSSGPSGAGNNSALLHSCDASPAGAAVARAGPSCGAAPFPVGRVVADGHRTSAELLRAGGRDSAAGVPGAGGAAGAPPCTTAAPHRRCVEPLQRVVGGFGV
jgi:uncharacterized protein (TIGR01615 family)